jgi:hypothetical protein
MTGSEEKSLFKIGDVVPESGEYICVPCGFVQRFEAGKQFTTCEACYAGTDIGPDGYTEPDAEFWEKLT